MKFQFQVCFRFVGIGRGPDEKKDYLHNRTDINDKRNWKPYIYLVGIERGGLICQGSEG
jgi:hypothetical protein